MAIQDVFYCMIESSRYQGSGIDLVDKETCPFAIRFIGDVKYSLFEDHLPILLRLNCLFESLGELQDSLPRDDESGGVRQGQIPEPEIPGGIDQQSGKVRGTTSECRVEIQDGGTLHGDSTLR